jgi:hypothetical protein
VLHVLPIPTELRHARSFVEHVVKAPKADEAAQATAHFRSRLAGNPKPKTNRSLNPNPNPTDLLTLGRDRYLSRQMKRLIQFRRYRHVDLYGYDSRNKEFTKLWQLAGTGSGPGITGKTDSLAIKFAQGFTATDC